jgi:hypothetical protein
MNDTGVLFETRKKGLIDHAAALSPVFDHIAPINVFPHSFILQKPVRKRFNWVSSWDCMMTHPFAAS